MLLQAFPDGAISINHSTKRNSCEATTQLLLPAICQESRQLLLEANLCVLIYGPCQHSSIMQGNQCCRVVHRHDAAMLHRRWQETCANLDQVNLGAQDSILWRSLQGCFLRDQSKSRFLKANVGTSMQFQNWASKSPVNSSASIPKKDKSWKGLHLPLHLWDPSILNKCHIHW